MLGEFVWGREHDDWLQRGATGVAALVCDVGFDTPLGAMHNASKLISHSSCL